MAPPVKKNPAPWVFEKVTTYEEYKATAEKLMSRLESRLNDIESNVDNWLLYCAGINSLIRESWSQAYTNGSNWLYTTADEELKAMITKKDNGSDALSFIFAFLLEYATGRIGTWITGKISGQIDKLRGVAEKEVKANYFAMWDVINPPPGRPDPTVIGTKKLADIKKRYDSAKAFATAAIPKINGFAKEKITGVLKDAFSESVAQYQVMNNKRINPGQANGTATASYTQAQTYDTMGDDTGAAISSYIYNLNQQKTKLWVYYRTLLSRGKNSNVSPQELAYFFSRTSWLYYYYNETDDPGESIEEAGEQLWNDDLLNISYRLEYITYLNDNLKEFYFDEMPEVAGEVNSSGEPAAGSGAIEALKFHFQGLYLASRIEGKGKRFRVRHKYDYPSAEYTLEPAKHDLISPQYPYNPQSTPWVREFTYRSYEDYLEKIPGNKLKELTSLLKFRDNLTFDELLVVKQEYFKALDGLPVDMNSKNFRKQDITLVKTAGRTVRNVLDNYEKAFSEQLRAFAVSDFDFDLYKQIKEDFPGNPKTDLPQVFATDIIVVRLCSFALEQYYKKFMEADATIREAVSKVETRMPR